MGYIVVSSISGHNPLQRHKTTGLSVGITRANESLVGPHKKCFVIKEMLMPGLKSGHSLCSDVKFVQIAQDLLQFFKRQFKTETL